MLRRIFCAVVAAFCMANACYAIDAAQKEKLNRDGQEAGKKKNTSIFEELISPKNKSPSGWSPPPGADMTAGAAKQYGAAELNIKDCYRQVQAAAQSGYMAPTITPECKTVIDPTGGGATVGLSPGSNNESSNFVLSLCQLMVDNQLGVGNPLRHHCETIVAAYNKMRAQMEKRDAAVAGAKTSVKFTDAHKGPANLSDDQIAASYSACTLANQLVSPEQVTIEQCEIEQQVTQDNKCAKTQSTAVQWQCPAGATSGPTLVRAGTLALPGQYTCQVPEPRNVYTCPAGWTGPANLPIPPGNVRSQACTNPADGRVQAAALTVQQVLVAHDATPVLTPQWTSSCDSLEVAAPDGWRGDSKIGMPPMVAFNSSEPQRCHLTASTCTPGVAKLVNNYPVTQSCDAMSETFACMTSKVLNTCSENPKCTPLSSECEKDALDTTASPPVCRTTIVKRSCITKDAVYRDATNCETQKFCPNGVCFDTGYKADKDFGGVTALLEAGHEAGRFLSAGDMQVFKGYGGRCRSKVMGGLFNCCDKDKAGKLFYKALHMGSAMMKPWEDGDKDTATLDENGKPMFSKETLDYLNTADNSGTLAASVRAVGSMVGTAKATYNALKDHDYKSAAKQIFWTGPRDLAHSIGDAFAKSLENAVTLFGILDGCDEEDWAVTSKVRGNLCFAVGSKVTETVPVVGWTWERTRRYCCFNSQLAMLINSQGRLQFMDPQYRPPNTNPNVTVPPNLPNYRPLADSLFGSGNGPTNVADLYGNFDTPTCAGFSLDQLKLIDFAQIDLKPFIDSLSTKEKSMVVDLPGATADEAQAASTRQESLIASAKTMYAKGCGGSSQCDGASPFASQAVQNGLGFAADATADPTVPGATPIAAQYLSLRPLMFMAFNMGTASGQINNEDIRLFSRYRFRKEQTPLTATVSVRADVPPRLATANKTCKLMDVTLVRPEVDVPAYSDDQILDPKTGRLRPPNTTEKKVCANVADTDTDTGRVYTRQECHYEYTPNGGNSDPLPTFHPADHYPGSSTTTMVTFCSDGSVPGASL